MALIPARKNLKEALTCTMIRCKMVTIQEIAEDSSRKRRRNFDERCAASFGCNFADLVRQRNYSSFHCYRVYHTSNSYKSFFAWERREDVINKDIYLHFSFDLISLHNDQPHTKQHRFLLLQFSPIILDVVPNIH